MKQNEFSPGGSSSDVTSDRSPAVDPKGRFAAVESCCTTAMACMRTLSYGRHACGKLQDFALRSQLSTALYDPLGCVSRYVYWATQGTTPKSSNYCIN